MMEVMGQRRLENGKAELSGQDSCRTSNKGGLTKGSPRVVHSWKFCWSFPSMNVEVGSWNPIHRVAVDISLVTFQITEAGPETEFAQCRDLFGDSMPSMLFSMIHRDPCKIKPSAKKPCHKSMPNPDQNSKPPPIFQLVLCSFAKPRPIQSNPKAK